MERVSAEGVRAAHPEGMNPDRPGNRRGGTACRPGGGRAHARRGAAGAAPGRTGPGRAGTADPAPRPGGVGEVGAAHQLDPRAPPAPTRRSRSPSDRTTTPGGSGRHCAPPSASPTRPGPKPARRRTGRRWRGWWWCRRRCGGGDRGGARPADGPLTLVLDDLHQLADPDATAGLDQLLRHGAGGLRLVVATRAEPPLGLARLRVAGGLTELGSAELAFTEAGDGGALRRPRRGAHRRAAAPAAGSRRGLAGGAAARRAGPRRTPRPGRLRRRVRRRPAGDRRVPARGGPRRARRAGTRGAAAADPDRAGHRRTARRADRRGRRRARCSPKCRGTPVSSARTSGAVAPLALPPAPGRPAPRRAAAYRSRPGCGSCTAVRPAGTGATAATPRRCGTPWPRASGPGREAC